MRAGCSRRRSARRRPRQAGRLRRRRRRKPSWSAGRTGVERAPLPLLETEWGLRHCKLLSASTRSTGSDSAGLHRLGRSAAAEEVERIREDAARAIQDALQRVADAEAERDEEVAKVGSAPPGMRAPLPLPSPRFSVGSHMGTFTYRIVRFVRGAQK